MIVRIRPLDAAAFAPFGHVVDLDVLPGRPVNEDRGQRHDLPVVLRHTTSSAAPSTAIYRIGASRLPFGARVMERHPLSDQLFLPLDGARCLVAVAPSGPGGGPEPAGVSAFAGTPGQAVVYRAGTWHLPLAALEAAGAFLMQMWETGTPRDTEVVELEPLVLLAVPE